MELWQIVLVIVSASIGGGGIASMVIKSRLDELRATEERLSTERREVYSALLDPYIKIFAGISRGDYDDKQIAKIVLSNDYRKAIFELGLLGSDGVIKAYNDLMQYFFKSGTNAKPDMYKTVRLWGKLRLEIRRSLGNKKTKLTELDMLRGEIIDIDRLIKR